MLDIYVDVRNSLSALTQGLRVSIANANNFNTPGYKYTYSSFATVFNFLSRGGTENINPMDFPGSATLGALTTDFSQGSVHLGTELDCAIIGDGFFVMSRSVTEFSSGSQKVYSRTGRFQMDYNSQYLTDIFGRKVYGFKVNSSGEITDRTPVPIDVEGEVDVGIVDGGLVVANYNANKDALASSAEVVPEHKPLYRVALTSFRNKQGLVTVDGPAYKNTISSGDALEYAAANESVYGSIKGGHLESSNIDIATVSMDMNLLNRGFSAVQGVIDDINKIYTQTLSKIG
ncbi:MAG: flagellar hook basal-body protein [bacterium]|nr:flagellar hook basal-body protein [bacterium]